MIIGAYYIDRSHRHIPCWTIANTLKEALEKAKSWSLESNCYVSVSTTEKGKEKEVALFDEKGERLK
ncbi:hypothetical protein CVD28_01155 [Bacillus sp. M6-12]|uniref:hypothetical protein n=1 Tax=Bacillus sp. M6-12 TaxID=2054166 RepID=UPI000C784C59|nr:hypothetical protein [Bacillus sp. M6-12]PLS19042.1 hypothetical protein CVD28_01155 [Bacillus sp. M6-12]